MKLEKASFAQYFSAENIGKIGQAGKKYTKKAPFNYFTVVNVSSENSVSLEDRENK